MDRMGSLKIITKKPIKSEISTDKTNISVPEEKAETQFFSPVDLLSPKYHGEMLQKKFAGDGGTLGYPSEGTNEQSWSIPLNDSSFVYVDSGKCQLSERAESSTHRSIIAPSSMSNSPAISPKSTVKNINRKKTHEQIIYAQLAEFSGFKRTQYLHLLKIYNEIIDTKRGQLGWADGGLDIKKVQTKEVFDQIIQIEDFNQFVQDFFRDTDEKQLSELSLPKNFNEWKEWVNFGDRGEKGAKSLSDKAMKFFCEILAIWEYKREYPVDIVRPYSNSSIDFSVKTSESEDPSLLPVDAFVSDQSPESKLDYFTNRGNFSKIMKDLSTKNVYLQEKIKVEKNSKRMETITKLHEQCDILLKNFSEKEKPIKPIEDQFVDYSEFMLNYKIQILFYENLLKHISSKGGDRDTVGLFDLTYASQKELPIYQDLLMSLEGDASLPFRRTAITVPILEELALRELILKIKEPEEKAEK
jgi:hypothetical protein